MRRYLDRIGMRAVEKAFEAVSPLVVRRGPFQGMRLLPGSCGSVWTSKLMGSYEVELAPFVDEIAARRPDILIDLGCAEGYFAIGFAMKLAGVQIIAADTNPFARAR